MNSSIVLLNLLRIALGNTKQDVMTIHSLDPFDTYNYNIFKFRKLIKYNVTT